MFLKLFLFEIRYRLRRPAFYVYFAVTLLFIILYFAKGDNGRAEKEWINSLPQVALNFTSVSIMLMLVSSAIMGTPLYRDLEYNTKEYYLSYPITEAGYFWGRFLGSFLFTLLVSFTLVLGAWLGCALGPALGWQKAALYGPNHLSEYIYPWMILVVPTLFFTSAFFFGLVAIFRNVKVIYSSGLFFLLGYILANFYFHAIHNDTVIYLTDPFLQNGMRSMFNGLSGNELNHFRLPVTGLIGYNRLIWVSAGALMLGFTWWRFSFERFFSGRSSKDKTTESSVVLPQPTGMPHIRLSGAYYRRTLLSLTRIELLNIIRDNYFWIILAGGYIFLSFVFWHGPGSFDVRNYPRTVFYIGAFTDIFIFFIFLIIVFYTGETVHREKLTRYAFINDALPPPDWVFNTAKLLSLCVLAVFLALTPMIIGLPVQFLKGYHHYNFSLYASATLLIILPKLIAMVLFCYAIHLIVNNKFAAHGVAISIWVTMFCLVTFNYFNYFPLLYSYVPFVRFSDMDGIGHMAAPIAWFDSYWTVAGLLGVVIAGLFFARGVSRSAGERLRLARQRFSGSARTGFFALLVVFLGLGGWVYYNVSFLNDYTTPWERAERKALVEKALKHYEHLPLPRITRLHLNLDLYPDLQREETNATITLINRNVEPIDTLLVDGDGLGFDISYNGTPLAYTCPLYFPRAKFNCFRSAGEPSDYRLYILPTAMKPGDTAIFQVHSTMAFRGFQNGLFAANALRNGMFSTGNLPGLGYDEGDEINDNEIRKNHGLGEKKDIAIPWNDSLGRLTLYNGVSADLIDYDLTVSTNADQTIQASGRLEKEWTEGGRHFYHFHQTSPGLYPPAIIASARYAQWKDTVTLYNGKLVQMEIDYHPEHAMNLKHFQDALRDGLRYYSLAYGAYPFDRITLVEASAYLAGDRSTPGTILIPEQPAWVADLRPRGKFDYPYYFAAIQLATQWWDHSVKPNATLASQIISSGIPRYAALALLAARKDSSDLAQALQFLGGDYDWGHRTDFDGERPLINANKFYEYDQRAALQLYALAQTIGTDSLNRALRSFHDEWAFRRVGPYPGAHDLYNALADHLPDSLRGWFSDAWFTAPTGRPHVYSPTIR
jgi:ABC-2 type transport system permease protein